MFFSLGHNFLDTFRCLAVFVIIFDVRVHFTTKTNEFSYYLTCSLIFEFTYDLLICSITEFAIFWVITVVKPIFVLPEVFINIFCLNLIT